MTLSGRSVLGETLNAEPRMTHNGAVRMSSGNVIGNESQRETYTKREGAMNSRFATSIRVAGFAIALIGAGVQCAAQTHFDNGVVSLDVPQGWTAQTSTADQQSVRMKSDTSANTVLLLFDKNLPREVNALGKAVEARAFSEVTSLFQASMRLSIEKGCTGPQALEVAGHKAIQCASVIKDASGSFAFIGYTAVSLENTTCLIVEFSSSYKGDVEALEAAHEVFSNALLFHEGDTWRTYTAADYSFRYPGTWQIHQGPEGEGWAGDGAGRVVSVRFIKGYANSKDTFNQCASENALLDVIYHRDYEPYERNRGGYPNTTVTHDDYQPGLLGGKSTWFSIVHTEAYKPPVSAVSWVNIVPRATGVYVVTYSHPSEAMDVSEPVRQGFARSIVFTSASLDKKAYCNYLGK